MQEEVTQKTIALVIKAAKLDANILKSAMRMYLNHCRKQAQKTHGKVSVKELVGEGAGASSIEITDGNIKSFERVARKYNVDFAVKKDKTTEPPKYLVFFKGRDADAVAQASAVLFCMPALGFAMNGNYAVSVHAEDTELERITFGVSVHGIEFDVIHVRNNENVLSLDFTHSSEAKESKHFIANLQTLSDSIGIDKVRVHRDMILEEVKDFVKQRFEHQLKQGGLDDISLYMSRFDTLYEQGKMEKLMPTANQKHIEENVPITEWDNPYFEVKELDQMAFSIKDKYVSIQTCTEGYDYSVFDEDYRLIDGGVYDNPDISIHAALKDVLEDFGLSEQDKRIPVDYYGHFRAGCGD